MPFLEWLENTTFSTTVRESTLLYPTVLALHSIGMGFLVGLNAVVDLRLLGITPGVPRASLDGLFPVMWIGFWVNFLTGLVLLAQSATHHLTDPVMYAKLAFIAVAVAIMPKLRRALTSTPSADTGSSVRLLALASLVLWTLAVTAGRLTAYTFFRFWEH
jgi:hypothetical protein